MFGRNKKTTENTASVTESPEITQSETSVSEEAASHSNYTAPKGRPTPSRKQQQQARRQPIVPTDRKAAKEASRAAQREARLRENAAMQTGDERYLPERDKGAQRRYIRDFVDARFNIGDFVILVLLVFFVVGLFTTQLQYVSTMLMWLFILLWVIDTWLMWRKLKKKLIQKFGQVEPGSAMYAINRVLMIRRFRLPKPQVKRGQYPN